MKLADMMAVGFHNPPKLSLFDNEWKNRAMAKPTGETIEEMSKRADELYALHARAKKGLVS